MLFQIDDKLLVHFEELVCIYLFIESYFFQQKKGIEGFSYFLGKEGLNVRCDTGMGLQLDFQTYIVIHVCNFSRTRSLNHLGIEKV